MTGPGVLLILTGTKICQQNRLTRVNTLESMENVFAREYNNDAYPAASKVTLQQGYKQ